MIHPKDVDSSHEWNGKPESPQMKVEIEIIMKVKLGRAWGLLGIGGAEKQKNLLLRDGRGEQC